ncbi:hypothetical protein DRO69_01375 [Candidatus Bathyarchaeota archaeon]|nr:MAG: hypothetical protein DRO69_01375 [Candidatus Bathyarchaeota archaeon]
MSAEVWYEKKLLGTLIIAILFAAFIFYLPTIVQYFRPARVVVPTYLYTEDLTVGFKIMDDTTSSLITSDVSPKFFTVGTNPFAYAFVGTPIGAATYDSTEAEWIAILDAGSYVLLVTDEAASKTKYPVKVTVSVPGTNDTDMVVKLDPYMIHMVERATPSISTAIYAYNSSSGAYDISVSNLNVTAYSKWLVEARITVAGLNKIIKAGRIYLTQYTGITVATAYVDGAQASVYLDSDSSDDGMTGYYILFPDWTAGVHHVQIYLQKTGSPSAGTITLTLFEYYECLNPSLRFWTDETASISVVT